MATRVHPMEKPSGQNIPPMGRGWSESETIRDAARTGDLSPEEIVEFSENESDQTKFTPLFVQAQAIILGTAVTTIVIFFVAWLFYPTSQREPTAEPSFAVSQGSERAPR